MFGGLPEADRRALDQHLQDCDACRGRAQHYAAIRDEVAGMQPAALPPEAREALLDGLRERAPTPEPLSAPPADPKPESTALHRTLFVVCALLALGLLVLVLMTAFRGEMEPVPTAAEVTYWSGGVQARGPGSGNWHEFFRGDAVLPGGALHTEADGLASLTSPTARWWMDGSTALALGDAGAAELAQGRICARCTATEQQPVRLMTRAGTVTCAGGEFVARMSGMRLTVACVEGSVDAAGTRLEAGQEGILAEEKLIAPVRPVRTAGLTHWLLRFAPVYGEALTPRRLASVPVAPEQPALPEGVSIEGLKVGLTARGPLVLVRLSGRLRNAGAGPCRAALSAERLMLPHPLAQTGPVSVDLPAGGDGDFRLSAVCVLPERAGRHILGLNPRAWTGAPIGRVELRVDAHGEGGLREVALPVQGFSARRRDAVEWSWSAEQFPADEPIVLDMELAKPGRVDALGLGGRRLCAWRPDAGDGEWISKGQRVLLAFDATADFGPGGPAAAQEVLGVLLGAIPPAVPTALVAYDGGLRLDREPWAANLPPRVESLLASLWRLEDGGDRAHATDFLARAVELAGGAQGERVLIYVTGAGKPADAAALDALKCPPDVRIVVVQVGAVRLAEAYARLCARGGGAAVALDPDEAPLLAGYDLLVALQAAAVHAASVQPDGGEVLSGAGRFANAPVVALAGGGDAEFRAEAGGRPLTGRLEGTPMPAEATGEEARALLESLRNATVR